MGITFNPFTGTLDFTGAGGGGGGSIGGSIAATQVAFGSGANTITGKNEFTYNSTTNRLNLVDNAGVAFGTTNPVTLVGTGSENLTISDAGGYQSITFGHYTDIFGDNAGLHIANPAGNALFLDSAGVGLFSATSPNQILLKTDGTITVNGLQTTWQGPIAESFTITSAATGTQKQQIVATGIYNATDGNPVTDGLKIISSQANIGASAAAKGLISNYIGDMQVFGSGSASNEYVTFHANVNIQIGTGYAQSAGPVGGVWVVDDVLNGPIGVQPAKLNGHSILVNNYYNGSPSLTTSAALTLTTSKLFGVDATHLAANSYPFDVGIAITGTSNDGSAKAGFTTGIQVGGGGGSYGETITSSKIGTGVHLRDYTTYGLLIDNPSGAPTASISADGLVLAGTFQPTSTYKSVDGSTGATGTDTVGTIFKNGIAVTVGATAGGSDDLAFYCGQ